MLQSSQGSSRVIQLIVVLTTGCHPKGWLGIHTQPCIPMLLLLQLAGAAAAAGTCPGWQRRQRGCSRRRWLVLLLLCCVLIHGIPSFCCCHCCCCKRVTQVCAVCTLQGILPGALEHGRLLRLLHLLLLAEQRVLLRLLCCCLICREHCRQCSTRGGNSGIVGSPAYLCSCPASPLSSSSMFESWDTWHGSAHPSCM